MVVLLNLSIKAQVGLERDQHNGGQRLMRDGLILGEITPGVDMEKDVLMEFELFWLSATFAVADNLLAPHLHRLAFGGNGDTSSAVPIRA